jgi:PTS system nitrogen regulatory IIA component
VGLIDVLNVDRVSVSSETEGEVRDKPAALMRLSSLLAQGADGVPVERILHVLTEREAVQSTGVGGGVAVPHGAVEDLKHQVGALLVCPEPIAFDAIDGEPVSIMFALVGPKGAPAQHLKILARMSRLLRNEEFRKNLKRAPSGRHAFELIMGAEQARK